MTERRQATMSARTKIVEGERSAATELGLVAALITVAIGLAVAATGGPILELADRVLGI
jgi:hypothetical protein